TKKIELKVAEVSILHIKQKSRDMLRQNFTALEKEIGSFVNKDVQQTFDVHYKTMNAIIANYISSIEDTLNDKFKMRE
ncbi:unnamed protein product, partial [Didymodactylos carnosus]